MEEIKGLNKRLLNSKSLSRAIRKSGVVNVLKDYLLELNHKILKVNLKNRIGKLIFLDKKLLSFLNKFNEVKEFSKHMKVSDNKKLFKKTLKGVY